MVRRTESKPSTKFRFNKLKVPNSKTKKITFIAYKFLDYFPSILAAIATFLTLAALIHEWGFYSALNIDFGQSPIGVADQFKIVLSLIPSIARDTSILTLLGALLAGFEDPNDERSKFTSKFWSPLNNPYKFMAHFLLIGAATLFLIIILFSPPGIYFTEALSIFVLGLILFVTQSLLNKEFGVSRYLGVGIIILIYTPFWLYGAGFRSGMENTAAPTTLYLKDSKHQKHASIVGTLLRSYDQQLLIRTSDGQIIFLPTNEVGKIQFSPRQKKVGLICQLSSTSCNE